MAQATADDRRLAETAITLLGDTFAEQADIDLTDSPKPLFQVLVLSLLVSARISADTACDAAVLLFERGWRTAAAMRDAPRHKVTRTLGRAGYVRYDERTATSLEATATMVVDLYDGDLCRLAAQSGRDTAEASRLLRQFHGIGPVGAGIFLREVQDTWTWVRPYFDTKSLTGAELLGLPTAPDDLGALAPAGDTANLAAALARIARDPRLADRVRATA